MVLVKPEEIQIFGLGDVCNLLTCWVKIYALWYVSLCGVMCWEEAAGIPTWGNIGLLLFNPSTQSVGENHGWGKRNGRTIISIDIHPGGNRFQNLRIFTTVIRWTLIQSFPCIHLIILNPNRVWFDFLDFISHNVYEMRRHDVNRTPASSSEEGSPRGSWSCIN